MSHPTSARRLTLYAAALFIEAALLSLAHWQYTRWQGKLALAEQLMQIPAVTLHGTWLVGETSALENQPKPTSKSDAPPIGRRIFTPLQTEEVVIIVDRGWLPRPANRAAAPDFTAVAPATNTVSGYWAEFPHRKGLLRGPDTTTHPRLLAWLNPTLITSATIAPQYLQATTATAAPESNLIAHPPMPPSASRHAAYAIQWLVMALVFPVLCLSAALRRPSRKP